MPAYALDPDEEVRTAYARASQVNVTPMKARRVIDLIRHKPTEEALAILKFAPQAAAGPVAKVLASAIANATNNFEMDEESLMVSRAYVDEGPTLKRFQPRAQGRAYRIRKRTCHITIEVESVESVRPPVRSNRRDPKPNRASAPSGGDTAKQSGGQTANQDRDETAKDGSAS